MAIVLIIALLILLDLFSKGKFWVVLRGAPDVKSTGQANAVTARRIRRLESAGQFSKAIAVLFGILRVPLEELSVPTIVFGLPRAGKTTLINIVLASLFSSLYRAPKGRTRFVILDIKNEAPQRLQALLPQGVPLYYMNPLDARAAVIDCPVMFPERSDIEQLAHAICPPVTGDQNPFFRDTARQLISLTAYVLQKFQPQATRPWGLLDLCAILVHRRTLRRVLRCDFEAYSFFRTALGPNSKASGDVYSTVRSVVQPLIPAALVEAENPPRFNLKSFNREDGVAVLGLTPTGAQSTLPIYNVLIRRLVEEALLNSHPEDRLFLILDEIAMLNRAVVQSIVDATCVGRSAGIHVLACTQSLELLEARFGTDQAHAFLASCGTTVGFRCGSQKTAEYVVGRMGNQEGLIYLTSWTSGKNASRTVSEQLQTRPTVMVEEILHAPLADPIQDRMQFYMVCPAFGTAKVTCPFVKETTVDADPSFPNFWPRPSDAKSLRPLSEADLKALGLPPGNRPQP